MSVPCSDEPKPSEPTRPAGDRLPRPSGARGSAVEPVGTSSLEEARRAIDGREPRLVSLAPAPLAREASLPEDGHDAERDHDDYEDSPVQSMSTLRLGERRDGLLAQRFVAHGGSRRARADSRARASNPPQLDQAISESRTPTPRWRAQAQRSGRKEKSGVSDSRLRETST
jgi:hypothetical protein